MNFNVYWAAEGCVSGLQDAAAFYFHILTGEDVESKGKPNLFTLLTFK